jgi:hypothetical protein
VSAPLSKDAVLSILAALGDRGPAAVDDVVGSLELAWLITEVEQRYSATLELGDEQLASVRTVDDATVVLNQALEPALNAKAADA